MYSGYRRRRWLRWALLYFAIVIAVAVIGLIIEAGLDSGKQPPQAIPPTSLTPLPEPPTAASSGQAGTSQALTRPVQLIHGTQVINGVALGYPHSTAGAVSAACEFAGDAVSTLDPDRAAAVMRLTAAPSFTSGPQQAAQGTVADRKALGVPTAGPVPVGYSFVLSPQEYQVRDVSPDKVTVLLLSDFISTTPGQGTVTRVGVFPVALHWTQGDWKVLPVAPQDFSGITAEPGSAQAAALGWQQIEP